MDDITSFFSSGPGLTVEIEPEDVKIFCKKLDAGFFHRIVAADGKRYVANELCSFG